MVGKIQRLYIIALLALAVGLGLVITSDALQASSVGVAINAPTEVAAGSSFAVDINVTDVAGFDAGQFDVSFDETVIRLEDVVDGSIGTTPIPVAVWNKIGPGVYRVVVNVPGVSGVDGPGSLATLNFQAIGDVGDKSAIGLSNGFISNDRAEEIAATWAEGSTALVTADAGPSSRSSTVWWLVFAALPGAVVVLSAAWLARRGVHAHSERGASHRFR